MEAKGLAVPAKAILSSNFQLVSFDASTPLATALASLISKDIYSAPVKEGSTWLGFLELADIVAYLVQLFASQASVSPSSAELAKAEWKPSDLAAIQSKFDATPVKQLLGRAPFIAVPESTPLQEIINSLVSKKLDRMALVDASGNITAVVSPSSVVTYLSKHTSELDQSLLQKSLDDAKIGTRSKLTAATRQESTISAFAKISENHISHLALQDPATGVLVGNLSVKDIKLIQVSEEREKGVKRLLDPVGEYVNEVLRLNLIDPPPALHADVRDSIEKTMARLAIIRIHRLYLTSSTEPSAVHHPVGVVSLRDLLAAFVKEN